MYCQESPTPYYFHWLSCLFGWALILEQPKILRMEVQAVSQVLPDYSIGYVLKYGCDTTVFTLTRQYTFLYSAAYSSHISRSQVMTG